MPIDMILRVLGLLALGAALLIPSMTAYARDSELPLTEDDFFAAMPTVLSASRLVQPLAEAPVAMTIIDREMIEASSAVDVASLLRLVPGFQVTYAEGVDAISTYQGFADHFPKRMQVLVDGRSVYNPGINGVVWSALPLTLNEIERIEVVRGTNAAAYGSNAFLGTINIVSRSPESSDRFSARAMAGSSETHEGEFSYAGKLDAFAYSVTAAYAGNDGFDNKFDDSVSRLFNFRGVSHPSANDTISVYAGIRQTDFESEAFRVLRDREYQSHYQQLVWDKHFDNGHDMRLQAFHSTFRSPDNVFFTDPGSGLALNVDYTLITHRYDVEIEHRWSPAEDWRVAWGGGLRRDTVSGAGLFDTDDDITRDMGRLFANVEWHPTRNTAVNLGVMGEEFQGLGGFLSPRVAVNWHPVKQHTLRVSAARAYRMPTVLEQRGEVKVDVLLTPVVPDVIELLGTPDNTAERIHSFEIGYLVDVPSINGEFDFRLFHNEVDRILYEISDKGLPNSSLRYDDAGEVRTNGFEFQARLHPSSRSLIHLAYAYTKAEGGYITKIDAAGNPIPSKSGNPRSAEPSVPRHTLTLLGSTQLGDGWRVGGTFFYVSPMEWLGEGDFVDRQVRLDAKLSKTFRHVAGDVELSVNVHNILDDEYWEFTPSDADNFISGNLSDRRIYAQVKVNWR